MHEATTGARTVYDGRVVRLDVLDVRLEDGSPAKREIVRHAPAVAVLPRLPDGTFLLVRQFRKAMEADIVELCAGLNEPGEAPEAAARRELREETGCTVERMTHLGTIFASPGYTDEVIDLYFAECAAPRAEARLDEDERVEVVPLREAELEAMVRDNRIRDGKTVAAWALYRLRMGAHGD
ncbi:MAG: NUDIX hydrolase [Lentisphaerae bacterium]|nr:NUDIX hydrolase [Lentisphaerota bacterium]